MRPFVLYEEVDMTVVEIWEKIKAIFESAIEGEDEEEEREIKEVESWDGAASNYADSDAYCAACLIDVNAAAGRDEKAQTHCMLPVRESGDSADTYVKQAVYAAAGGRGIGRVERPDDVPDDAWASAVKAAANKIISAYGQMDEVAPASVYEIAGKEPPEGAERAISLPAIYDAIYKELMNGSDYLMDVFTDDGGQMYAVLNSNGALLRAPLMFGDGAVTLGERESVQIEFTPTEQRGLTVMRQDDGRYRWVAVICTAILNRAGEIDSRALFGKFVERIAGGEPYPLLDFWHLEGTEMGHADYVAQDDYTLVASGLFDDTDVAREAAQGLSDEPEYWGTSIKYLPTAGEIARVADGIDIPVYTDGVLLRVSILPEHRAAALYTTIGGVQMRGEIREALLKLLRGREDLVGPVEALVDGANERAADPNVIAREVEPAQLTERAAEPTIEPAPPVASEADGIAALLKRITDLEDALGMLSVAVRELGTMGEEGVRGLDQRVALLERTDAERKRAWLSDLPAARQFQAPVFRPREQAPEAPPVQTAAQRAQEILKAKGVAIPDA
jgi:hypothetical protein